MGTAIENQTKKKSFVLYTDTMELWDSLSDEQAGKLIKHIYSYAVGNEPEAPDEITRLLSIQIKKTMDRDQKKWEEVRKSRSKSGKKGGRPSKAKKAIGFEEKQNEAKKAVSVNANATVNENESDDEEFYDIDFLYQKYLYNKDLIKAVKEKVGITETSTLEKRLLDFNKFLKAKDQCKKTWKDYTAHFLSWQSKSPKSQYSSIPTFNSPVI